MSAKVIRIVQEFEQLFLRCLMEGDTVLTKNPYIMNFMVL